MKARQVDVGVKSLEHGEGLRPGPGRQRQHRRHQAQPFDNHSHVHEPNPFTSSVKHGISD
jgi:hypothetical protein